MIAAVESHIAVVERRPGLLQCHPYFNLSPPKLFMLLVCDNNLNYYTD